MFSLLAPLALIFTIYFRISFPPDVPGILVVARILLLISAFVILGGFVLGIMALASSWRHGVKGVRGRATAGIIICGAILFQIWFSFPAIIATLRH